MPRLVDGDNLLGTWKGRKRSDAERRVLASEIGRLARRERRRIVVVFDGEAPTPQYASADVIYAGAGRSADAVILALLRKDDNPRGWTVVTLDRSLADQCRWIGASVERCDAFRTRLGRDDDPEKPDRVDDLAAWEALFSEGDDDPSA